MLPLLIALPPFLVLFSQQLGPSGKTIGVAAIDGQIIHNTCTSNTLCRYRQHNSHFLQPGPSRDKLFLPIDWAPTIICHCLGPAKTCCIFVLMPPEPNNTVLYMSFIKEIKKKQGWVFDLNAKYKFDVHIFLGIRIGAKEVGLKRWTPPWGDVWQCILKVGPFKVPCSLRIASHQRVDYW